MRRPLRRLRSTAAVLIALLLVVTMTAPAHAAPGPNLAAGKPMKASGSVAGYGPSQAVDGNQETYWESTNNDFPQWLQVDLGSAQKVSKVITKLPTHWPDRTQTIAVQGSDDGSGFTDIVGAKDYAFTAADNGTVAIAFSTATTRFLRLHVTKNTGWPAGQFAEFEVYGPDDTEKPSKPTGLAFTQPDPGKIKLTWDDSTDNVGVTGYDVYANGKPHASVTATTYTDTRPATETVTYTVRAKDAAGNLSDHSDPVTRNGEGDGDNVKPTAPSELAFTEPAPGQIKLTWQAATDNVGVTAYDIYANGQLKDSVGGDVLTYTDNQPDSAIVTYTVRARDAAGNQSDPSNAVTRKGDEPGINLAAGKPIEASGHVGEFVPANANDDKVTTYWEANSGAFPNTLTVKLGADADLQQIVLKLNPDAAWSARTQNIQVLGRAEGGSDFSSLKAADDYRFDPADGNTVTVPVTGSVADVRLKFNSNTGAAGGQVAEFQVIGAPAPNPDLTVTDVSWTPESPDAATEITLRATVKNAGNRASPEDSVDFHLGGTLAGTVKLPALEPGASTTVSKNIGARPEGSYVPSAHADTDNSVRERNEDNNAHTADSPIKVGQAPGPDLEVLDVTPNPATPSAGTPVSFTVRLRNRGTDPAPAGVTRVKVGSTTLDTPTGAIPAGETVTVQVDGTWKAVNGGATITVTADATGTANETNEENNELTRQIVVGRGAAAPYTSYEAEAGTYSGKLLQADPKRQFRHTNFASESSGRESVQLNGTGEHVEITSTVPTNSIVVRNSIPDAPNGGGIEKTISLYANGEFVQKLKLSSKHSWLYGLTDDTEGLSNTPQPNAARRLFDESHALLEKSYPAGTKFRLQRDSGDDAAFYIIDTIDLEQVAPAKSKPADCTPITEYGAVPNDGKDDTDAIQAAVMADQDGKISCVWIPAGRWRQEQKVLTPDPDRGNYNQKGIRDAVIRGAGMWHTQLYTTTEPQNVSGNINHPHEGNVGFDIDDNVQLSDLAIFGMTTNRAYRGHGLNGRFGKDTKVNNVWIEHVNVGAWVGRDYSDTPAYWNPGSNLAFSGMRIRNTYADGINLTNGTHNSKVFNSTFRTTGDDALALWANPRVKDPSANNGHDNTFSNNTVQLPWRANGIAVYGGYDNTVENNLVSDTANYPGIMIATDHDPLPFSGQTLIANNGLYRCGGAFWGEAQFYGALTLFAPNRDIPGVVIRDTEIHDSTYDGIQFKTGGGNMPNVKISDVRIDKSNNGAGILAMSGARGSATLTNVDITNSATGDIVREPGTQFTID